MYTVNANGRASSRASRLACYNFGVTPLSRVFFVAYLLTARADCDRQTSPFRCRHLRGTCSTRPHVHAPARVPGNPRGLRRRRGEPRAPLRPISVLNAFEERKSPRLQLGNTYGYCWVARRGCRPPEISQRPPPPTTTIWGGTAAASICNLDGDGGAPTARAP